MPLGDHPPFIGNSNRKAALEPDALIAAVGTEIYLNGSDT